MADSKLRLVGEQGPVMVPVPAGTVIPGFSLDKSRCESCGKYQDSCRERYMRHGCCPDCECPTITPNADKEGF